MVDACGNGHALQSFTAEKRFVTDARYAVFDIHLRDLFARTAISPVILPIGAITSFLGGPLFLYLLFKGGKKQ